MHNLPSMCILTVLTAGFINDVKALPTGAVECGIARTSSNRKGRILNGNEAEVMQFPWIASIKQNGVHKCGGAIISGRYILSAAHCFNEVLHDGDTVVDIGSNPDNNRWVITLGEHIQTVEESFSSNYTINKIIVHKEYSRLPLLNDIVLLELTDYIQWTNHIQPICLPEGNIDERNAMAAGWGRDFKKPVADNFKLRYVHLDIFDNDNCVEMYRQKYQHFNLDKTQMCAGKANGEIRDTTEGDSGGPLLVNIGGRQVLVGITSTGAKDTIYPKPPGIYTKVFEYMDWIKTHVQEMIYSPVLTNNKLD